jgi:hypothetical protein
VSLRFRQLAILTILIGITSPGEAAGDGRSETWRVASDPQLGHNLAYICLAFQAGQWVDLDPLTLSNSGRWPNGCDELLIADRDSRWVWPNKAFYQKRQSTDSRLFEIRDSYSLGYLFTIRPGVVEQAMNESGATRRLEAQIASGAKNTVQVDCEKRFEAATTQQEITAAVERCEGYNNEQMRAMARLAEESDKKALAQQASVALNRPDSGYILRLQKKYSSRVTYDSDATAKVVRSFDIECRAPDKRVLPLLNVLYAKVAAADGPQSWLVIHVASRDGEYRITDSLVGKNGPYAAPEVSFEINKWGELTSPGIRMEAVLNACFGSYGPIWVLPGKK